MKRCFVCMKLKFKINFREEIHTYMKLKDTQNILCIKKPTRFNNFYFFFMRLCGFSQRLSDYF
ncbi:toxin-antitoxin system, toxin component [Salmonella enterica]|uniref:Toxin-antitoxin system, toxin component n=2 Tax=Salmonella enterica TaxID=28901 RepID=A0A403T3V2_SALER|nr:toxin-antitoxin system, toxin component [Salmonella enterica]ECE6273247.1 toxin-antitoxin system, toxin component [Salmonella enterica subsp. diarizonae]EBH4923498.1 toxin-antitoxin system, toxin component [Salmonella enterica]ECG8655591.1 toxin-antitoxin system, toxin component [Salmonella enterica subsp. diarizonae]ECH1126724.1 toxin-antitoxin system, toxin component [Salmonella enterica subsp. diarizonae]